MMGGISRSEHLRLRAESQRIRAEAIRVRISAVHAYCSVLESEARWHSREKALDSMARVWHVIAELKRHLAEPEHIPAESAPPLHEALDRLEERAIRIHQAIQDCGPMPDPRGPETQPHPGR